MRLLDQKEAMQTLNIKSRKTFLELEARGLPFIQVNGKGTKKQYYFPDMLVWMKDMTYGKGTATGVDKMVVVDKLESLLKKECAIAGPVDICIHNEIKDVIRFIKGEPK